MRVGEENSQQFESRKKDHIRLSLEDKNQAFGRSGLEHIQLVHEALPDLNFDEIDLTTTVWGEAYSAPLYLNSMTAGHTDSVDLNLRLAKACAARGWLMGVGSQRKELSDLGAGEEWRRIYAAVPSVRLVGNIGISQLIHTPISRIQDILENLRAKAIFVHLNALQECLQPEGTPQFKGGLSALQALVEQIKIPVVVKETGCGMSPTTIQRLFDVGVRAVDVSGLGGTHWGRIEGGRMPMGSERSQIAETFADWGLATVESVLAGREWAGNDRQLWASGGVRSGLDAAKLIALGAEMVGFAKPLLESAMMGEVALNERMQRFELELKTALFCTGCKTPGELREKQLWQWRKI